MLQGTFYTEHITCVMYVCVLKLHKKKFHYQFKYDDNFSYLRSETSTLIMTS